MAGQRPISVVIIAVLKTVDGLLGLASGCALLAGGGALAAVILGFVRNAPEWLVAIASGVLAVIGLILIAFAIVDFVLAWGVWKLQRWAWWLTTIVSVLSVLGSLGTLAGGNVASTPSVAINATVLVLLLTSDVRQVMGVR